MPWHLRFGFMPPHCGIFVKRQVYKKFGLYKENYLIASDYEFCIRIFLKQKINFAKFNFTSIFMREGGASTNGFKSMILISKEIIRACKENLIYTNYFFILLRVPLKLILKYTR